MMTSRTSKIVNWTHEDVVLEIAKHVTDPIAADLLQKLLRVKPKERLNSFTSVLEHPFFDKWRPVPEPVVTEETVDEDGQPMDMATAMSLAASQRAEMVAAMLLQLIVADKDADHARARRGGSNALGVGGPAESTDSFGSYLRKAYGNNMVIFSNGSGSENVRRFLRQETNNGGESGHH